MSDQVGDSGAEAEPRAEAGAVVTLLAEDVPGAELAGPLEKHPVAALGWWLLCRGIKVPTSVRKKDLIDRVKKVDNDGLPIVDVDGSYLYRKYKALSDAGENVLLPSIPPSPISGWIAMTNDNYQSLSLSIPPVTQGLVYTYLAGHVGHVGDHGHGAFRALSRGYNHWASGRIQEIHINTNNPHFCHVKCKMQPSMKVGVYNTYILLGREGEVGCVKLATCECAAGQSASCTHVSALLHALSALNTSAFKPGVSAAASSDDEDEAAVPCTSQPCRWKQPKKRKESNLRLSDASFEKHDYAKPVKRKIKSVEDFDPRPESFRNNARSRLPDLLQKIKGEQLCISLLFDPQFQYELPQQPSNHNVPDVSQLKQTIIAFKRTLELTAGRSREIERDTREQRNSPLWFAVRSHRITASFFGSIISRRSDTPPDSLVLRIIQPKNISTPAIAYGIDKEKSAIEEYITIQRNQGHKDLVVAPSGVIINPSWSFLGASPDGAVYDPSNLQQPYGFLEVKCPYSVRNVTPTEACSHSGFCSRLNSTTGQLELKETHQYYAQVQGQMAIGERMWCDFVLFTLKGVSIQRVYFDQDYWNTKLLPKLISFYDNCVAPELVSPIHPLGLSLRDLSKM